MGDNADIFYCNNLDWFLNIANHDASFLLPFYRPVENGKGLKGSRSAGSVSQGTPFEIDLTDQFPLPPCFKKKPNGT